MAARSRDRHERKISLLPRRGGIWRTRSRLQEGQDDETVYGKTLPLPRLRQGGRNPFASAHFHRAIHSAVVPHASRSLRRMLPARLLVDFHASA